MNRIQQLSRDIVRGRIVVPLDEAAEASRRRARLRPRKAQSRARESTEIPGTPGPRASR
jgi:hypothetical protein